jgi:hypothetical protein
MKTEAGPQQRNRLSQAPRETQVKITLVARPLFTLQKLCRCEDGVAIHEQNVCSFSNITWHRNRLLLFVKHLAMRILTRKYRIIKQYTDWQQNFGTQEMFSCLREGGGQLL